LLHVDEASPIRTQLAEHTAERSQRLQDLNELVREDARVAAAWVYGSLARGNEDDLSDIDVRVVVHEKDFEAALAARYDYVAALGEPIMVLEAPQNRPHGGAYNMVWYQGVHAPHAVDWTWSSAATTHIPTGVTLLHNRANLAESGEPMVFAYQSVPERDRREELRQALHGFWSMLLVVAKYAARSPYEDRMGLLQWTIPQLRKAQQFSDYAPGPPYEQMPPHPEPADKMSVLRSLAAEASALTPALAERGVEAPVQFEPHVGRYLDMIEAVMNATKPFDFRAS
jgi:predicted nucleotidyltransferase